MRSTFHILFFISAGGVLIALVYDMELLHTISKPLIMPSLFLFYMFGTEKSARSVTLMLAMVFAFAGDVLLMKKEYFLFGLISFLLAHLCYIVAYRQHRHDEVSDELRGIHRLRLAFPIILATSGLIVMVYPGAGDMKFAIVIYGLVIMTMVLTALFRYGLTSPKSFWLVLAGATLFLVSDSLIAIDRFLTSVAQAGVFIMLTYSAAQYLILRGLMAHEGDG